MKATFFIPLIATPIYAIRDTGIEVPFTVLFLLGAYKKNGKNWRLNLGESCPMYLKDKLQIPSLKDIDMIFGIPPCRFLSMLNVKHDRVALGDSQNCMIDIAKLAGLHKPKVFCFLNAPRFSSAKRALQWAIPTLIDLLKPLGYKFAIYKTTTLNHGLPQKRLRTFFIAYQGPHKLFGVYKWNHNPIQIDDLIGDLYNQDNNDIYKTKAQNKLQLWLRKDSTHVHSHEPILNWFYWKLLMKYCISPNKSLMWQMTYKGQDYGYNWKQMLRLVKNLKDHDKLKKIFEHALRKMSIGKGYWDSSPMLARGKNVNAIISKNAYRLVHPNKQRLLTLRLLSRFMGIPDRFKFYLSNRSASLHYITQNVPSFTYADVRLLCKKYVDPNRGAICPSEKDLIYILNISDLNKDLYYEYNRDLIVNSEVALGRDKKHLFALFNVAAPQFIERI